ncbi:MAG TPA: YjgN family protein [Telluria sp.]
MDPTVNYPDAPSREPGFSAPPEAANDQSLQLETHRFTFTGSGSEYFRIWIVNLFLSIVTLGVYSAWAKVRRMQYFDRNTQLAGASFDFDGDPKAILRGRLLAVAMLAAYQYAFGFSMAVGIGVVVTLLVMLPFMMRGALRFRLRNTRYRGLRFNFSGSAAGSYGAYLPPLLIFLMPAVLVALDPSGKLMALLIPLYIAWPLMHGAMKRYQHQHLEYGSKEASFELRKRKFYKPYFAVLGLGLAGFLAIVVVIVAVVFGIIALFGNQEAPTWAPLLGGVAFVYVMYLVAGPYIQVRVGNMVWSNTTFPGLKISSHLKARAFMRLQTGNAILTLLTLGLYRPFAVVRAYKYRLDHVTVQTDGSFEHTAAGVTNSSRAASSDGVADFLGVDLSW